MEKTLIHDNSIKPDDRETFDFDDPSSVSPDTDLDIEDDFSFDDLLDAASVETAENNRSPEARQWYNSNTYYLKKNDWKTIYQNLLRLRPLDRSILSFYPSEHKIFLNMENLH